METFDCIVLGAGGVGSAALSHLSRRGVRALAFDRFPPPHAHGSSHGETRIIRQAYFEHPDYVPLLVRAYAGWTDLERRARRTLFTRTGLLQVGPPDGRVVPAVAAAAERHGLAVERLTPPAAAERFPFRVPAGCEGILEANAGFLRPEECVRAALADAQASGCGVRVEEVRAWHAGEVEVRVETAAATYRARHLVITPGAWAGDLLADLGVPFLVRRKPLFWYECPPGPLDASAGCPCFLFELPAGVFYGFPRLPESRALKVAEHTGGREVPDPLCVDREVDADERARIEDFLAAHLPHASRRMADHRVCLYTMTPDEHFVLDRHPRHPRVVFAAGLSGHGFKLAGVLGEALADLVTEGGTELPIDFLSLARFAAGRAP